VADLDPELLDAFVPEFVAACDKLGEVADGSAARRALDPLRAMAEGFGIASLAAMLTEAAALLEAEDLGGLRAMAPTLAIQARAIAAAGADLPPAANAPAAATRIRTLVVDDSPTMRRIIRDVLASDPDFEVVGEAADGAAALVETCRLRPDLTLLDIEMPVLDGLGALRLWALEGIGAVVVVSSAARPGSATALEARRLGAGAVVGKPSGALSLDMAERSGAALLAAARRVAGLPVKVLAA
jgi:CheY-like chemotaxis protein